MQPVFQFSVCIAADSLEEAEVVLCERLNHDEDYGFDYEITSWAAWPYPEKGES
jgi:hypothetical protein